MNWLLLADLHLTDRPRDAYRFGLFDWLEEQQRKYDVTHTFILGDITDKKDNHSAKLVNQTIMSLMNLQPPISILMGNHDFVDPANPFFGFLTHFEGLKFVTRPYFSKALGVMFIPHQPDQAAFDAVCKQIPAGATVMLHQTFDGAVAETGAPLTGLRPSAMRFRGCPGVWAGDVHRPQQCGPVTYVGAPFQVRFGDDFQPRVLLVQPGHGPKELHYPCLKKWAITIYSANHLSNMIELKAGDQVKLTVRLPREEIVHWAEHKQRMLDQAREMGLEVFGIILEVADKAGSSPEKHDPKKAVTPRQIFEEFCASEKVPETYQRVGEEILNEGR